MKKTIFCILLGISSMFLLVAVTEGQIFSLAASGIRTLGGSEPSDLFDSNRVHTMDMTIPFSVLAAGDIASCASNGSLDRTNRNLRHALALDRPDAVPNDGMVDTARLLENNPEATVLALGDLVYKRGEPVEFEDCYDPYWGAARARTWPAPGNHEYQSPFAYGYFDYWQDRAGPDRNGYYALRAGNWLILSLNSEIDASPGSAQANWIKTVLDAQPDSCLAAYYHKPAFTTVSRSRSENAQELFRVIANAGAIFVLNGHNHFYERTQPLNASGSPSEPGTVTFVAGAGGKMTFDEIAPAAFSDRLITGTAGVLKLDFSDEAVAWTYLTGDGPTETDSGTLPCR